MERWRQVQAEIEEFRRFLYADFPPLEITAAYDFAWANGPEYKASRKDGRYGRCGVYLFFEEGGTLLYVGKALWTFDKRIWTHDIRDAKYIDLICFDDRHYPFALALEHFLICRLKPAWNTQGVSYTMADAGHCPQDAIGS